MIKIYSKVDPTKLLHIVNKSTDINGRVDIIADDQFLQLSVLNYSPDHSFRSHHHIWKDVDYSKTIAQESWVVIKGSVNVTFYDTDNSVICSEIIGPGDCSVTLEGGHGYEILEKDTVIYEYKTGPYQGQLLDKRFINQ